MWTEASTVVNLYSVSMYNHILDHLPYKSSFRFVDNILQLDADGVTGEYTLKKDSFFYEDHFPGYPVTPGAIIMEIMAQTGLLVLGIYLILNSGEEIGEEMTLTGDKRLFPSLTSTDVSFYKMVKPGQKVTIVSKKQYFRFGKLKCYIEMLNQANELVAKGMFAGVIQKADLKNIPI